MTDAQIRPGQLWHTKVRSYYTPDLRVMVLLTLGPVRSLDGTDWRCSIVVSPETYLIGETDVWMLGPGSGWELLSDVM